MFVFTIIMIFSNIVVIIIICFTLQFQTLKISWFHVLLSKLGGIKQNETHTHTNIVLCIFRNSKSKGITLILKGLFLLLINFLTVIYIHTSIHMYVCTYMYAYIQSRGKQTHHQCKHKTICFVKWDKSICFVKAERQLYMLKSNYSP